MDVLSDAKWIGLKEDLNWKEEPIPVFQYITVNNRMQEGV